MNYLLNITIIIFIVVITFIFPQPTFADSCPLEQKFSFASGDCEKIFVPENAVLNSLKTDWLCQVGYKKIASKNICQKVVVPEHGKLNYSGDDFICERGFIRNGDVCEKLNLPENAVLEATGNDWTCIATYQRIEDKCVKVELPKDAKFFSQGFDWYCNNQFRKEGSECQKFEIPANAHLTYLGNDWQCNKGFVKNREKNSCESIFVPQYGQVTLEGFECDPGYDKQGNECIKVDSMEHGKFYDQGIQFYCESGYRRNEELRKCEKIEVSDNARLDSSSIDGWSCISGYIKKGDICEKFTTEHIVWQGSSWTCELGYIKDFGSQICQKVNLPEHAHLEMNSDGWTCDSGYVKNYRENRCDKGL
jgi:hypothetical protein